MHKGSKDAWLVNMLALAALSGSAYLYLSSVPV